MGVEDEVIGGAAELRRRAEARELERAGMAKRHLEALLPEETRHMLHELRVHQIELELQNEELRRTSIELDALRAQYFDLYDLAPVGYATLDQQGDILQANLTAATLLGVSRTTLQGAPFSRFIHPADQDAWYLHHRRLSGGDARVALDLQLLRQPGATFWAHLEGVSEVGPDGAHSLRLVLSDISERRGLEAAAAELAHRLEQAQRLESVGRLAGGVAHDSNNMLGVIIGHAELALLQPGVSAGLRADIEQIREAAERSGRIVRQLLAFASQEIVRPRAMDLEFEIRKGIRALQRVVGDGAELSLQSEPSLWPVWIDPAQLDQILTNLCVNARDAMVAGGTIRIGLVNRRFTAEDCVGIADAKPGDYVVLRVEDDGHGMDAHTLAHLFEPFFSTKPNWAGTGLGLASVYGSVRQNRGFIRVRSEPGRGAEFAVHLPRHNRDTAQMASSAMAGPLIVSPGHETILVVEDDPALLRLTERVLAHAGYTVLTAGTPSAAIRMIQDHPGTIHLLLTDVVMPEMNGRELAAKSVAVRPGLRCLVMSGFSPEALSGGTAQDEVHPFLQKPISIAELTLGVRRALDAPRR